MKQAESLETSAKQNSLLWNVICKRKSCQLNLVTRGKKIAEKWSISGTKHSSPWREARAARQQHPAQDHRVAVSTQAPGPAKQLRCSCVHSAFSLTYSRAVTVWVKPLSFILQKIHSISHYWIGGYRKSWGFPRVLHASGKKWIVQCAFTAQFLPTLAKELTLYFVFSINKNILFITKRYFGRTKYLMTTRRFFLNKCSSCTNLPSKEWGK